jgi:hypothetical protein
LKEENNLQNEEEIPEEYVKSIAPLEKRYDPYNEDDEPQWVDVDVTEFENVKLEFKPLPGKEVNKNSDGKNEIEISAENEKEKLTGYKEESSLYDESHDHSHLDKIMKLNFANEDEKTNDNIIFKDDK